jgi:hypothetical protein
VADVAVRSGGGVDDYPRIHNHSSIIDTTTGGASGANDHLYHYHPPIPVSKEKEGSITPTTTTVGRHSTSIDGSRHSLFSNGDPHGIGSRTLQNNIPTTHQTTTGGGLLVQPDDVLQASPNNNNNIHYYYHYR